MHFGRIESDTQFQALAARGFNLPPDAPRTQALLKVPWGGQGRIHAGCPIWNVKEWVGGLYPERAKAVDFLTLYSEQLGTVELNSSFYHLIDAPKIAAWKQRVRPGFRFCPKVYRGITENPGSPLAVDQIKHCAHGFAAFGETYGLGFAQFPETFTRREWPLLKRVLDLWPRELPLAVEFRHPSWFENHVLSDDVVNLLYRYKTATVITDTPGRRDVLHTSLSQPRVLVRFLGRELDPTDGQRLDQWVERILNWANQGLEDIYLFTHQPTEVLIPETANLFLTGLQMRGVMDPAPWVQAEVTSKKKSSQQRELFNEWS